MSTYENNNNPAVTSSQTFSHGYGPNAGPSYKPPEQPGHYSQNYAGYAHRGINDYKVHSNAANMSVRRGSAEPEGESAAYDNQADNDDSHSLPDRQTVVTAPPHRIKSRYNDRGIKEYFYKRPDPTYEDIYGVAQPPQLDKTRVLTALAVTGLVIYGVKRFQASRKQRKVREQEAYYSNYRSSHTMYHQDPQYQSMGYPTNERQSKY